MSAAVLPRVNHITFEASKDMELVKAIITHRRVWPWVSDDCSPAKEDWQPPQGESITYLVARDMDEVLGCWMIVAIRPYLFEVHTCLLPNAYGPRALEAARLAILWVFENTACERMTTNVPEDNSLALKFAVESGFRAFGCNHKSFKKKGQMLDQIMLGLNKEDVCRQQ